MWPVCGDNCAERTTVDAGIRQLGPGKTGPRTFLMLIFICSSSFRFLMCYRLALKQTLIRNTLFLLRTYLHNNIITVWFLVLNATACVVWLFFFQLGANKARIITSLAVRCAATNQVVSFGMKWRSARCHIWNCNIFRGEQDAVNVSNVIAAHWLKSCTSAVASEMA